MNALRTGSSSKFVDALKFLFVDMIKTSWASTFPWSQWIDGATELSIEHATIAGEPSESSVVNESGQPLNIANTKTLTVFMY